MQSAGPTLESGLPVAQGPRSSSVAVDDNVGFSRRRRRSSSSSLLVAAHVVPIAARQAPLPGGPARPSTPCWHSELPNFWANLFHGALVALPGRTLFFFSCGAWQYMQLTPFAQPTLALNL